MTKEIIPFSWDEVKIGDVIVCKGAKKDERGEPIIDIPRRYVVRKKSVKYNKILCDSCNFFQPFDHEIDNSYDVGVYYFGIKMFDEVLIERKPRPRRKKILGIY